MSKGLSLDLRVGERLLLDSGRIAITLEQKNGQRVRIRVEAGPSVKIGSPQPIVVAEKADAR